MQQRLGIIKSTRRLQPHAASNTSSNAVFRCTLSAILEHEHEQARARLREASYQIWSAVGLPTARADREYYQHLASCNPLVVRNELSRLQCCRHILSGQGLERRRESCEVRMRMQTSLDGAVGSRWGAHVNEHVFARPSLLALRTRTRAHTPRANPSSAFSCETLLFAVNARGRPPATSTGGKRCHWSMIPLAPATFGFLVAPPAHVGGSSTPLPLIELAGIAQQAPMATTSPTALVFPADQPSMLHLSSSSILAVGEDAYITPEFDAAFVVVIPVLFGGVLFAFYKLLKLFASAF